MSHSTIYHITTRAAWEQARAAGVYTASSLTQEGFIHASTREQVVGTANLFFKGADGLVLLAIATARLSAELRYEWAIDVNQSFPHIYGPLNLDAVVEVVDFPPDPLTGQFHLPQTLTRQD